MRLLGEYGHLAVVALGPQTLRRRDRGDGPTDHDDPFHGCTVNAATGHTRTAAATRLSCSASTSSRVRCNSPSSSSRNTSGAVCSHSPWPSQRSKSTTIRVISLSFHVYDGKRNGGGHTTGLVRGMT